MFLSYTPYVSSLRLIISNAGFLITDKTGMSSKCWDTSEMFVFLSTHPDSLNEN